MKASNLIVVAILLLMTATISAQGQCYVDLDISSDAQVHDINSNNNYGHSSELMAKRSSNGGVYPIQRAFFNFDWSCIPDSAQIDSARLFLYHKPTSVGNSHQGDNASWLRRVDEGWGEMTVTWNNQPSTTTINQIVLPSQSGTSDLSMLVTPLVQDILNETSEERHGFMMKLQSETDVRRQNYASSDYNEGELSSKLRVYFNSPTVNVTSSADSGSGEIVLGDTASFTYRICNSTCCPLGGETMTLNIPSGFTLVSTDISPANSASFSTTTLTIDSLASGECFDFRIRVTPFFKTALGIYDFCLNPNSPLVATGTTCAQTNIVKTLSITDAQDIDNAISIYPNPADGTFWIESSFDIKEISVINVLGRSVYKSNLAGGHRQEIDLSDQSSGVYLVTLSGNNNRITHQIILD